MRYRAGSDEILPNLKQLAGILIASVLIAAGVLSLPVFGDNCFILSRPTSDPAPSVFTWNGVTRLYVYCTQDKIGFSGSYPIDTIHCYSTADMFHWKDEGAVLDERSIPWALQGFHRLWAPHVYFLNGRYQLIAPESDSSGKSFNFTAWSTTPVGDSLSPAKRMFTPASAGRLPGSVSNVIDPFCFIDSGSDSVRVWLSYRHQNGSDLGFVRMNDSGTAVTGDIKNAIVTTGAASGYKEGSWMFERNGIYFLVYAYGPGNTGNEIIAYSTAHNATGPWVYRGKLFDRNSSEYTIHSGCAQFNGQWYIFWHSTTFAGSIFGNERCSGVEYLRFVNDSTIDTAGLKKTNRGVGVPNAYTDSIQIDRGIVSGSGIGAIPYNTTGTEPIGWYLTTVSNGATVRYDSVDFTPDSAQDGPVRVSIRYGATVDSNTVSLFLDSVSGTLLRTIALPSTGGLTTWSTCFDTVTVRTTGRHNLWAVFKVPTGSRNLNVNWVKFWESGQSGVMHKSTRSATPGFSYRRTGRNSFVITSPGGAIADLRLLSLSGRTIMWLSPDGSTQRSFQVTFDAQRLSSGLYLLTGKNRGGTFSIPVVF